MQEYEREEEGITLGELFRVIFKRVWVVVGVTLAITAIAVLIVALLINTSRKEYRLEYTIEFPGHENSRYPDGTAFRYQNLISLATLNAVKASDEAFASVDTAKMSESNDITIVAETSEVSGVRKSTGNYSFTVKASYFPSAEVATSFLRKLAAVPVDYIQTVLKNANYDFNLNAYDSVSTYEAKIDYLSAQCEYLQDKYSELMVKYGESYRFEGRSISDYASAAALQFSKTAEQTLRTDLELNGYVYDKDAYKSTADLQIRALQKEKEENVKIIAALREECEQTANLSQTEALSKEIVALTTRNIKIETELETINTTLANLESQDNTPFDRRLTAYYNNLKTATETLHSVISFVYNEESEVTFDTSKVVVQGDTSLILAGVGGLFGGFIVACAIVCIIDLPKYFKAKKSARQTPVQEQSPEQAE